MSKSTTRREVAADAGKFADLYRDIRGQFMKGMPRKVILRHIRMGGRDGGGGGDAEVTVWEGDFFEGRDPNDFAQTVITDILEDAKIFPAGIQRYGLFFWTKDTAQHQHRMFVTVQGGGPEDTGDVFNSEEANEHGRTSQLMRHDEGYTRLALQALHNTLNSKDRTLDRYESMIDKLMGQFVPVITAMSTMADRTAEREFKLERDRKLYGLLDEGGEMLMKYGPVVAAKLMEKKSPELSQMIMKVAVSPAGDLVNAFMTEIETNPDKAGEIFQAVSKLPNGTAIIQQLAQLHAQQKAQAAAAEAAKQQKNKQPETTETKAES